MLSCINILNFFVGIQANTIFLIPYSLQDIPIAIAFKAMGICSDQEIMQLIGTDDTTMKKMGPCIMECHNLKIFTQNQALAYFASKLKVKRYFYNIIL